MSHAFKAVLSLLLCSFFLLYVGSVFAEVPYHGATRGEFSVSPSGATNYSVPIEVPPGINGVQPNLSLSYSSQNGNGIAGLGWTISGLSKVTKCPTTIEQDGFVDGVDFDENDQFCLNGIRLIPLQVVNCSSCTAEYRAEIDDYQIIKSFGSTKNPSYFKVETKSGITIFYGNSLESTRKTSDLNNVLSWSVNRMEDSSSNYMTFSYYTDNLNGIHKIRKIDYSGNNHTALTPTKYVEFNYSANRPDPIIKYMSGSIISVSERLTNIKTYEKVSSYTSLVKDYRIEYVEGAETGRSLISKIKECSITGKCKLAIEFESNKNPGVMGFDKVNYKRNVNYQWASSSYTWTGDFDGNGLTDVASANGGSMYMKLSTGNGYKSQTWPMANAWGGAGYTWTGDFNGDGLTDIASASGGSMYMKLSTGSGFKSQTWPMANAWGGAGYTWAGDFNGDGLTDIASASGGSMYMKLSTGSGFKSQTWLMANAWGGAGYTWAGDFNGDGLTDIASASGGNIYMKLSTGSGFSSKTWSTSHGWGGGSSGFTKTGDFNGDGLTDIVSNYGDKVSMKLSTGMGFKSEIWSIANTWGSSSRIWTGDFNGDGITDIASASGSSMYMKLSTGSDFESQTWPMANAWGITSYTWPGDFNGDGLTDIASANGGTIYTHIVEAENLDAINQIVSGNTSITINSKPMTDSSVYKKYYNSSFLVDGKRDIQNTTFLVESVVSNDGMGNEKTQSYKYEGAKTNFLRRGSLGFSKVIQTDQLTGISISTEYSQEYPYVGNVLKSETRTSAGKLISSTTNTYNSINGLNGPTYKPYLKKSINQIYEINSTSSSPFKTITKEVVDISTYGEPKEIIERTEGLYGASPHEIKTVNTYAAPLEYGAWLIGLVKRTEVTANNYVDPIEIRISEFDYYSTGSIYGAPGSLKWQKEEPDVFGIDIESIYVQTDFIYDQWGMPKSVTTTGDPSAKHKIASRSVKTLRSIKSSGEPNEVVTDALEASLEIRYDQRWGKKTYEYDIANKASTTWSYDEFGNLRSQTNMTSNSDAITTTWNEYLCDSPDGQVICIAGESYYQVHTKTGEQNSHSFYDQQGRLVRSLTYGYFKNQLESLIEYNERGFIDRESKPYFKGTVEKYWTSYQYDVLGREIETTDPVGWTIKSSYLGLTTSTSKDRVGAIIADAEYDLVSSELINPVGQILQTIDYAGNNTYFDYYPFGEQKNTRKVVDGIPGAYTINKEYDSRGRLIKIVDPDMGTWKYEYDALGQLRKQIDGKNQVSSMNYDLLGRLVDSTDHTTGEKSVWQYYKTTDPASVGRKVGGLKRVYRSSDGYEELYKYNMSARQDTVTITMDGNSYDVATNYDNLGRVSRVDYPRYLSGAVDGNGNPLYRQESYFNHYDENGYLIKVSQSSDPNSNVYWSAIFANSSNQITREIYGNSLVTDRTYDRKTGSLTYIGTGSFDNSVQYLRYQFDNFGNLETRVDHNRKFGPVKQTFSYDRLNRLDFVDQEQVGIPSSRFRYRDYSYNALGNLIYKSDVGTYGYTKENNAGPHAATRINGGSAFIYDKNGNLEQGRGRTVVFSSFNKPTSITQAGSSVTFKYNPSRSRYKKMVTTSSGTTTTHYLGKLLEINQLPSGSVEYNHNIYVGNRLIAVVKGWENTSNIEKNYIHTDHLGSIDVITRETPINNSYVKTRFNYDPFGKNQIVKWNDGFVAELFSDTTNRGFTGHEMLPEVGLIHMNGRVYDPELGRFISADPYIPIPEYSQSYNRYSYVLNNPLSFTDSNGYYGDTVVETETYTYTTYRQETVVIYGSRCGGGYDCGSYIYYETRMVAETHTGVRPSGSRTRRATSSHSSMYAYNRQSQNAISAARRTRAAEAAADDQALADRRQERSERQRRKQQEQFQQKLDRIKKAAAVVASLVGPDQQTVTSGINAFQKGNYLGAVGFLVLGIAEISPWGKVTKLFRFLKWGIRNPKPGTLSNKATRDWYVSNVRGIGDGINKNNSLRDQALEAFQLRSNIRRQARGLMKDRGLAESLPNMPTIQDIVSHKYSNKGLVGDALWEDVKRSAQTPNSNVNRMFGIK